MPSDSTRPLRLAVLGCGSIARTHARTLRRFPGVSVAFASRDPRRAAAYAERFGGIGALPGYEAAMADRTIDAVMILTPPHEHCRLALEAILAGKDVLVEKPAFLSSDESDLIASAAADTGRRVLVLENYGYKPSTLLLQRLIEAGEIGDLRYVRLNALKWQDTWGWRTDPDQAGGGALFEGGIHWIHLLGALGPPIERIEGIVAGGGPVAGERSMAVIAHYRGGAVGTLHHAWNAPVRWKGLSLSHVIGSRGTITFESNGLFVGLNGARRRRLWFPGLTDVRGYRAMFHDLLGCLRDGTTPRVTLERAREDLRLVAAAYRSAEGPVGVAAC